MFFFDLWIFIFIRLTQKFRTNKKTRMLVKVKLMSLFFLLLFLSITSTLKEAKGSYMSNGDHEQLLINKLMKFYIKKQKPAGKVQIKFNMILNQIINVKVKDQEILIDAFIDHEFIDNRMSWSMILYN